MKLQPLTVLTEQQFANYVVKSLNRISGRVAFLTGACMTCAAICGWYAGQTRAHNKRIAMLEKQLKDIQGAKHDVE